jgi:hypothetical protein
MMNRYLKKLSSIIFVLLLLSGNAYAEEDFSVLLCEQPETLGQKTSAMMLKIDLKKKIVFDGYNTLEVYEVDPFFIQAISYEKEYTIDRFLGRLVEYRFKGNGNRDMKSKIVWKCDKIERML